MSEELPSLSLRPACDKKHNRKSVENRRFLCYDKSVKDIFPRKWEKHMVDKKAS